MRLEWLKLGDTQVTDAGLVHLRELTKLTYLELYGTEVTDEGFKHLGGLKALQYLYLQSTGVTGTGLGHLAELPRLFSLVLNGSKADVAAVRRFKKERPDVRIAPGTLVWGWDNPARVADVHFTPSIQKIIQALEDDTRMEFIETPLVDVVSFLSDQHAIPIQLDESRLRATGISTDVPVTQSLKGITFHSALRLTLGQWGLSYVIRDDALVITTVKEAGRLIQQGVINAEEVNRELEKRGAIAKTVTVLHNEVRFQFTATPMEDVVAFLQRQHGIPIEIDRRALAAAGIRPDVRCTLHVKDVPLASALRKLLGGVGLTYVVDDEFILITAAENDAPAEEDGKSKPPADPVSVGSPTPDAAAALRVEAGEPRADQKQLAVSALRQELRGLQREIVFAQRTYDQTGAHLTKIVDALPAPHHPAPAGVGLPP